jgi:hypothetical protein
MTVPSALPPPSPDPYRVWNGVAIIAEFSGEGNLSTPQGEMGGEGTLSVMVQAGELAQLGGEGTLTATVMVVGPTVLTNAAFGGEGTLSATTFGGVPG